MKTFTQNLKAYGLTAILIFKSLVSISQPAPDFSFNGNALISGVDKTVGAQYRFINVATGVDALVTITSMVNASLDALDATNMGGYPAAFQPQVRVVKLTTGYIDFDIQFVIAGTSTPMLQSVINVTALDVDGYNSQPTQKLYEFEQFDMGSGAKGKYEFTGNDINVAFNGTAIKGTNVAGVDYGSISTSQNVRFTVYKSNVSLLKVRSGAINGDQFNPDVMRQRSFYFAMFTYTSPVILAVQDLQSFKGTTVQQNMAHLEWTLAKNHNIQKIAIERGSTPGSFQTLKTIVCSKEQAFDYNDDHTTDGINYYRLKLYSADGKEEYSNVVTIKSTDVKKSLLVYPTLISSQATISFTGQQAGTANIEVKDYNGRVYIRKAVTIKQGINLINVDMGTQLTEGSYLVCLTNGTENYTGKIMKVSK